MSKYTTELRYPVEQFLISQGKDVSEDNWDTTWKYVGLDDYPIFDEDYRSHLNTKIMRAYWFREIGFETWGQFRWQMRRMMHEIMPYYNQLYESENLITDPMYSKDLHYHEKWMRDEVTNTDNKGTRDTVDTNESKRVYDDDATSHVEEKMVDDTSTNQRTVFQDTPMNGLDTGAIAAMDYATEVTFDDSSTNDVRSTSIDSVTTDDSTTDTSSKKVVDTDTTSVTDYTGDFDGAKKYHIFGYDESQADLLEKYRDTFLNIDLDIINDLRVLFMGLW